MIEGALAPIINAKGDGLLATIYKDLAQPGVRQVGQALGTVLQLGSAALLPFRMLNETVKQFEHRKFEEIAKRFAEISDENLADVPPEIGVPILDKLSYTDDETLRRMFVELLAKAADLRTVELAHPSFVNVIANISPDEAKTVAFFQGRTPAPFLTITKVETVDGGQSPLEDFIMEIPTDLAFDSKMGEYIANLVGLGLLDVDRGRYLSSDERYKSLIDHSTVRYPNLKEGGMVKRNDVGDAQYAKAIVDFSLYGRAFARACVG